jgi:small subunit ribosomal protein S27Ae
MADKKPAVKKGKSIKVYSYYNVSGDKAKCTKKSCPKCGNGFFMSEHKDRFACGKCGYTEFRK